MCTCMCVCIVYMCICVYVYVYIYDFTSVRRANRGSESLAPTLSRWRIRHDKVCLLSSISYPVPYTIHPRIVLALSIPSRTIIRLDLRQFPPYHPSESIIHYVASSLSHQFPAAWLGSISISNGDSSATHLFLWPRLVISSLPHFTL
jgi:hypothetical protein